MAAASSGGSAPSVDWSDAFLMLLNVRMFLLLVLMVGVGGSLRSYLSLGMMVLLVFCLRLKTWVCGRMVYWMLPLP